LIIGIVIGLFLSSYIETPLSSTEEATSWPYSLSFRQYGVGPYGWGYNLSIDLDGSASVSYHREKTGSVSQMLTKNDLDEISLLLLEANILHLNESYGVKQGYYDWGFYNLTLTTRDQTKSVSWAAGESAVESTPKELHEIENYNKIVDRAIT
jgi:hypothetical protein